MDQPPPALHLRLARALQDTDWQVEFLFFWLKLTFLFVTDYAWLLIFGACDSC